MVWRPNSKAKSAFDILWHIAYPQEESPRPANKQDGLDGLRRAYAALARDIAMPGKLDESVTWWTGDIMPFRGLIWGAIRHRSYHLGELVYLRQAMGLDEPKYYHEE